MEIRVTHAGIIVGVENPTTVRQIIAATNRLRLALPITETTRVALAVNFITAAVVRLGLFMTIRVAIAVGLILIIPVAHAVHITIAVIMRVTVTARELVADEVTSAHHRGRRRTSATVGGCTIGIGAVAVHPRLAIDVAVVTRRTIAVAVAVLRAIAAVAFPNAMALTVFVHRHVCAGSRIGAPAVAAAIIVPHRVAVEDAPAVIALVITRTLRGVIAHPHRTAAVVAITAVAVDHRLTLKWDIELANAIVAEQVLITTIGAATISIGLASRGAQHRHHGQGVRHYRPLWTRVKLATVQSGIVGDHYRLDHRDRHWSYRHIDKAEEVAIIATIVVITIIVAVEVGRQAIKTVGTNIENDKVVASSGSIVTGTGRVVVGRIIGHHMAKISLDGTTLATVLTWRHKHQRHQPGIGNAGNTRITEI